MASGRAVAAMARSGPSSRQARAAAARARDGCGCSTRTWQRHSTGSTTTHLLSQLGTFPARELVAGWLTAGVVEDGRFAPTGEGTPQGGVISPLLLNVALHGMENAAGVRYQRVGSDAAVTAAGSPVLVRYADDRVALCHTRQEAQQVKARLAAWLAPRGLAFNEDKTRIVTLDEGFDFLGFNVRRYSGKLLIKPSKAAVRRIRERLRTEIRSLRGA